MTNSLHHSDDCFEAVCSNWENNKKQCGAQGPHYKTTAKVNHSAAEVRIDMFIGPRYLKSQVDS